MAIESRKDQEREFHNVREKTRLGDLEAHDSIYTNRQFYRITDTSKQYLHNLLERYCVSAEVLDYCCGTGQVSRTIAMLGGNVTGIDISDVSIETAQRLAEEAGISARARFVAGDAENTNFPDDSFDVVIASGVLHHVDLEAAYSEIARVLRPGGVVIGIEALAHNPLIMAYRRRTPHLRTPFEIDHILRVQDIQKARKHFAKVEISYWHLAAIGAIPFRNTFMFRPLLAVLDRIDSVLLRVPLLQKHAWQSIFVLSEPRAR